MLDQIARTGVGVNGWNREFPWKLTLLDLLEKEGDGNVGNDGIGLVMVLHLRIFDSLLHKLIDGSDVKEALRSFFESSHVDPSCGDVMSQICCWIDLSV